MTQQTDHVPDVRKKGVTAVELLHENNIAICEMLLYGKIGDTQYEQLINCFSINLEQAKQMEKEQIVDAHYQGYRNDIGTTEESEQYYNETYGVQK